jgi:hypothetical protein
MNRRGGLDARVSDLCMTHVERYFARDRPGAKGVTQLLLRPTEVLIFTARLPSEVVNFSADFTGPDQ